MAERRRIGLLLPRRALGRRAARDTRVQRVAPDADAARRATRRRLPATASGRRLARLAHAPRRYAALRVQSTQLDLARAWERPLRSAILACCPRMWRNWQTRRLQVPVGATPWR